MHPHQLQCELRRAIEGKKFLIVLDDVWNEHYNLRDILRSEFTFGASGGKIIVTTRNKKIGPMMGTVPIHYLGIISDEDSWQLFAKHAFPKMRDQGALQDFEEIGRGIVSKCSGLPLAIKSLGGLLCSKMHIDEWEDILNSDTWKLQECNILPALWLSYNYLALHLKRCFAYCSIFPKDFEIYKDMLIQLWMAKDLLRPQQNMTLEEIGEKYFNDLISRSFIHRTKNDLYPAINHYHMHDLVNDLASFVSGEFCLRMDDGSLKDITKKTRHLSCMTSKIHDVKKLEEYLSENKALRTLLFKSVISAKQFLGNLEQYLQGMGCLRVLSLFYYYKTGYHGIPITTSLDLIGNLKLLKYLNLSGTDIKELPGTICTLYNLQSLLLWFCRYLHKLSSSVGNLKRLRYLNLSMCSNIKEIPNGLCDLHDLHTLSLNNCKSLSRLPTDMSRLVNLHDLDFFSTEVREMPPQMGKLKHLQRLTPAFLVDKNGGFNIRELGNLHDLRGLLRIQNLENIVNVGDLWEAKLKDKRYVTEVEIEWCGETGDSEKARGVLDRLQPHTNVRSLKIRNYKGTRFPSWIGHQSFSHIVSLSVSGCSNCYLLPPLAQLPSLKDLCIWGFEMVERIGDEFYYYCGSNSSSGSSSMINAPVLVPFKSLESLYLDGFSELRGWKEWSLTMGGYVGGGEGTGAFPQLKTLQLSGCPKINGDSLPSNFPSFTTLQICRGCQRLVASLQSHQLPWLGELKIFNCSGVVSFPPQVGLPANIHKIVIDGCHELKSLAKQGWPSNLKSLRIEYCEELFVDVDSFPEEEQLPTTLTRLKLICLPNLKSLNGKALRDLVCLKRLTISHCNQLQCLPEETLPDSLSWLNITSSHSRLAERCKRDTGEDWPKIVHIPRINVDGNTNLLQDSDEE